MKGLRICATGRALPRQIVTNDALSRRVDTSDAWIASRTGIRERRFCCGEETAASLAADAAGWRWSGPERTPDSCAPVSPPPSRPTTPPPRSPAWSSSGWACRRNWPALT